jgi:chorismate synthase
MSSTFGRKFKITVFGESHGKGIGVVIDGVPANLVINEDLIKTDLNRRRPGQSSISTPRNEKDQYEILSGIQNGRSTGAPLTFFIRNEDKKSKDYSLFRKIHRPSQIDYPAILRYGENVDLRGSGKFSGRLTAPIVIAGAIAKMILSKEKIKIGAYISQIGNIKDNANYSVQEILSKVETTIVRAIDDKIAGKMINLIEEIKKEEDSIGGIVTVQIEDFPAGIGDPLFQSLESSISAAILSIPSTRGIEFGAGFAAVEMKGSEHNDSYILENGKITTKTNNCGGIIGGISIGTPIKFRVPIKPTASIGKVQTTLNFETKKSDELIIEGRHDPCIAPRALVGIEAITSVVLVDHLLFAGKIH